MKRLSSSAGFAFSAVLFSAALPAATSGASWSGLVSSAGLTRIERNGREAATLTPGLYEKNWRSASMTEGRVGQDVEEGRHRGKIVAPGGGEVEVEVRVSPSGTGSRFDYRLTPKTAIDLNSLHVSLSLPAGAWAGGSFQADQKAGALPQLFKSTMLHSAPMKSLRLTAADGASLQLDFARATPVLVQDDRQWGQTFSIRVGPQFGNGQSWPAGRTLELSFALSGDGGLSLEEDGPVTITAGRDWLPLDVTLDVEPGSALDFSSVIPREAPAGKHGRVIVNREGKFAFAARPEEAARFYGVNLCFSAHYLEKEVADRLADRLWRLGYNALRVHHYERDLVDRSVRDGVRLRADQLAKLDHLFAELKKRGLYVSTDLFVSRPVPAAVIYPGEKGDLGMDEYKMAVHVNERAFEDFKSFARALLGHVNPETGLRYADDPALAWLSLVNEDNPGNFISRLKGPLKDDWQRAWNEWLKKRYPDRRALIAALGQLPDDQSATKGNVPLQDVYSGRPATTVFNVFLAEVEQDFFRRVRTFLREELKCGALLTDMNAWTNPVQMQAVRAEFDYVDDHFYVDHPRFLERPWSLPSSCPNTSPVAGGAAGGRNCAFTRLFGKPFTITEFNYSSPGKFRGVGGILTGALGAVQDWDGVWRFAYSHNHDSVARPAALNYFDVSSDPLNQAAERASLCLFLRGDIQPAQHAVTIQASAAQLLKSPAHSRDKTPPWHGLAWLTKVGWNMDGDDPTLVGALRLPLFDGRIDPLSGEAGASILGDLRKRGWLAAGNRTDAAKNRFQSENGEVTIDASEDILTLDTERTAGGFAPAGKRIETGSASIEILDTDATVWISSLDEHPIPLSRRLLVTHLTDLQNTGARYAGRVRKVLLSWGKLPHLVQAGRATVTVRVKRPSAAKVYGLSVSGKRQGEITGVKRGKDTLTIPLDIAANGEARMLYEVTVGE